MTGMELSLAEGWTQVEPRDTGFQILLSGQSPGQNLISSDTAFRDQREIGFSGGVNCPIAVDEAGNRVFVSVDGISSYELKGSASEAIEITGDASPVWMLAYDSAGPDLLMHLRGEKPKQSFFARLNLGNGSMRRQLLPEEAFVPLAVDDKYKKFFYRTRHGAAVYQIENEVGTLASIELPFSVVGGAFLSDEHRVIFGGRGLWEWDTKGSSISRICEHGAHPAVHNSDAVWFTLRDGALAKLSSKEGSFEVVVALAGLDTIASRGGSYAQPLVFSPDRCFGLARLTGREKLIGKDLDEAEAFCKTVGQPMTEFYQYRYKHYICILDFETQQTWCNEGYAQNVAWVSPAV